MYVQKGIKQMPHMLEVPIGGFDKKGQHTHECEYCEEQALCQNTFYVRHREIGDTILCRVCADDKKMQKIFPALKKLIEVGSNITDVDGVYRYGLELQKVGAK